MLGQSSRVALITSVILEKLFGINITMDSSEIIRFTPIASKTPLIYRNNNKFSIARSLTEMEAFILCHSDLEAEEEIQNEIKSLQQGKVTNQTFVEIVSQNISNIINFAKHFVEDIPIEDILKYKKEDFENYHDIFKIGRLSTEMENNINLINTLMPYYKQGDFKKIHNHVKQIIDNYYIKDTCKAGTI